MIKALGFDKVVEVSFGADLIANEYAKIIDNSKSTCISSDCPAIVYYIEHYYPHLVTSLAPLVSPMVATARVVKKEYGDVNVVFIGPCIAKKAESYEIDEAITFKELRELFLENNISSSSVLPVNFDPPLGGKGAIFPVSSGLLQTANKNEDLTSGKIIVASGSKSFRELIDEYDEGLIRNSHLELLCCDGCIMGPGMSKQGKKYSRRECISNYVKNKLTELDTAEWEKNIEKHSHLDLSKAFAPLDRRNGKPSEESISNVLKTMGKVDPNDFLNCGACGYNTCREHAIAIIEGLAENEMCLPYSISKLHKYIQ